MALPAAAQVKMTQDQGLYQKRVDTRQWSEAGEPEMEWLNFYQQLYQALLEQLKPQDREGLRIYLGGSDVYRILLGQAPVEKDDIEINIIVSCADPVDNYFEFNMNYGGRRIRVEVNPERSYSLYEMMKRKALARRHYFLGNIFLKWNMVEFTAEGLSVYAINEEAERRIRDRKLELPAGERVLTDYELQYNLNVAYRALRQSSDNWQIQEEARRLIFSSIEQMPREDLIRAIEMVINIPAVNEGRGPIRGYRNILFFLREQFGAQAANRVLVLMEEILGFDTIAKALGVDEAEVEGIMSTLASANKDRLLSWQLLQVMMIDGAVEKEELAAMADTEAEVSDIIDIISGSLREEEKRLAVRRLGKYLAVLRLQQQAAVEDAWSKLPQFVQDFWGVAVAVGSSSISILPSPGAC